MSSYLELAGNLIAEMNLREKIAQMYSVWLILHEDGEISVKRTQIGKRGKVEVDPFEIMRDGIGQISRPLGTTPLDPVIGVRGLNRIQKFLVENTRLGIPALPHEECLAGVMADGATLFPAGLNLGSLWDQDEVEKVARMIGAELFSVGARQGLAPVLDVSRDARWGRTEETMGEDPYLVGSLATAYTRGLQGENHRVLATLKHFAGHSFSEGGRNHAPVRIGERELYDTFLLPFEMVIKSLSVGSVLPAYHDIDGIPFHESHTYLTEVLRNQWGFEGLVVSDYQGISLLHQEHRVAEDMAEAAALAIKAGIDVELPGFDCFAEGVKKALDRGLLDLADIHQAVRRVLIQKYRLGLFDHPYTEEGSIIFNSPQSRAVAAEAAEKSLVLLKNSGVLPLKGGETIALVGPLADERLCMLGGYSFPVHVISAGLCELEKENHQVKTLREVLTWRCGSRLIYEKGCEVLHERPKEAPVFPGEIGLEGSVQKTSVSYDTSGFSAALQAAEKADCIVAAVGDLSGLFLTGTVGEGSDVSSLQLPGVQQQLLEALADLGKPLIVVMFNGRPYHLGNIFQRAAAVLEAWLPGQAGAQAVSEILFGEKNPGGKLPVSLPKKAGAMPFFYNYKLKSAGTPIQPEFGAEYPFGYGLSYTRFSFSDFSVPASVVPMDGVIRISFRLTNTGEREGDEVVQLYVRDIYASLVRPVRELKGFKRLHLKAGESVRVTFSLPTDVLSFTGYDKNRILEPGDFEFLVGNSSRDIFFNAIIRLEGAVKRLETNWRMVTDVLVEPAD
ncbi:MAG: glycoside hydrolase family 3 C-terminal domain-containing protein [Spirochaetales bacterium]|nr:glycoside hydrolase family 3 C-terminal domain-containing protein [Spirochaetales bacterium]